ncbi:MULTISPECIES: alternative ribosome rescue aminoacyl-tRNA hydrolase ArfB [Nonlabens]|uniref:Ribosome-associated protein n=1 Tax=Nonlabens xylanidelens TaxID=191564 RepID=A0A2S6IRK6_9FLAO|nr:alternative ribosome rescue aminoacyl-tRNA hydrolase ArfB [Nonlabens xylanidelens]PPK96785.1 ribosome-associated protein [Nonlabens xylanidelens]PQJ13492.1 aminoacyl-tRNA hydrolase [Nonlabens xylanidelens]
MNIEQLHKEVQYKAVASSGPGGQNVNKVATKVQLYFDVLNSLAFAKAEHERIKTALFKQLTSDGVLQVNCQESRSQAKNKELVFKKLLAILSKASVIIKVRRKRTVPKSVKRKRLNDKKKHSDKKKDRNYRY